MSDSLKFPPCGDTTKVRRSWQFDTLNDDHVLFWIRIKGKASYFKECYPESFLKRFTHLREYRTISEYTRDASVHINLGKYRYSDLTPEDRRILGEVLPCDTVVKRCRGLRAIAYAEAKDLIFRCGKFFLELFRDDRVRLVVCNAVDNYVMDVMVRVGRACGVDFLGITASFMEPNYKLVSLYGEHNLFNEEVDPREVAAGVAKLKGNFRSALIPSRGRILYNAVKCAASYCYRTVARYIIKYKILGDAGYEYRFAREIGGIYPVFNLFKRPRFLWQLAPGLLVDRENTVYVPLHYYPEATVDYWTDHPEKSDYLHELMDVLAFFRAEGVTVLVKEHPAAYLLRPPGFYSALLEYSNVKLLSPFIQTRTVFERVQNVVVWNGSTGVEALLQGKSVSVVTESYYSDKKLEGYRDFRKAKPLTEDEQYELLRRVLETSLRVDRE